MINSETVLLYLTVKHQLLFEASFSVASVILYLVVKHLVFGAIFQAVWLLIASWFILPIDVTKRVFWVFSAFGFTVAYVAGYLLTGASLNFTAFVLLLTVFPSMFLGMFAAQKAFRLIQE